MGTTAPPDPRINPFLGLRIIENPLLTETITVATEVKLTWKERLWLPLLHGATLPFEPWVKTRIKEVVVTVASPRTYLVGDNVICHPEIAALLRKHGGFK